MKQSYRMHISNNASQQQALLFKLFETLTFEQRCLLRILSVVYKPISRGHINQLCRRLVQQVEIDWPKHMTRVSEDDMQLLVSSGLIDAKKDVFQVNRLLANLLTNMSIQQRTFLPIIRLAEEVVPVLKLYDWEKTQNDQQRLLRDYLYLKEYTNIEKHLKFHKNPQQIDHNNNRILVEYCFMPFNYQVFSTIPNSIQYQAFATWLYSSCQQGLPIDYPLSLLQQQTESTTYPPLKLLYAEYLILNGELEHAQKLVAGEAKSVYQRQLAATMALLNGNTEDALVEFEQAIRLRTKLYKGKPALFTGLLGFFHKLAMLILGANNHPNLLKELLDKCKESKKLSDEFDNSINKLFFQVALSITHSDSFSLHNEDTQGEQSALSKNCIELLKYLAKLWTDHNQELETDALTALFNKFEHANLNILASICKQINDESTLLPFNFANAIKRKPRWNRALSQLKSLTTDSLLEDNIACQTKRLIWVMHCSSRETYFTAKIQNKSSQGWSNGKAIALKHLIEAPHALPFLSKKDKTIIHSIEQLTYEDQRGALTQYKLSGIKALRAIKGVPTLFKSTNLNSPIELLEQKPSVLIETYDQEIHVSISHLPGSLDLTPPLYSLYQEQIDEYQFRVFDNNHLKVARIIGEEGLILPLSAKDELIKSVQCIAPLIDIQSCFNECGTSLKKIRPNNTLIINIKPYQEGLMFTCVVMPFGDNGPVFKPANGAKHVTAMVEHERLSLDRNLTREQQLLDELDTVCPVFKNMRDNQLKVGSIDEAYSTLLELEQAVKNSSDNLALSLRWPKGKALALSTELQLQHLQLSMYRKNEWFNLHGELKLDDDKVIKVKELLALAEQTSSRFIKLDATQVLCLSEQLKTRLDTINQVSELGTFHPLARKVIDDAISGMRMKTLHAWEEQTLKMHEAEKLSPKLSVYLNADLRQYQIDGFKWAMRLAHWGAGACLADDMGLGKTIQALAVIQARADKGPTLIVAPTSVCFNWHQEATKFTPTITLHRLKEAPCPDEIVQLAENDCLIISYSMMQKHIDVLNKVYWQTIIADEAQALKNPVSQRAKAAYRLKSQFKMITTGTPLENNLSELWSLFRFVNPGLLGNLKVFNRRFALPIEQSEDDPIKAKKAAYHLKMLLQPFILRRLKTDVLTELPQRTQIDITIPMNEQEKELYEAIRLHAIEKLASSQSEQNKAAQRMQIFAELTRLRQACSNPNLVSTDRYIESSKIKKLSVILTELRQNNHKVLIFSQFIGSLKAVKNILQDMHIHFHYLDGATPTEERKNKVNAFQRGEGEVFLISLKAGGSGLNLTQADYVIHLDPWWNPAVEAQASDRAHRIGQTKPVTIYRLIANETIEEKIIKLHTVKKALAENVLDSGNLIESLSVQELLGLLKETF